MSWGKVGSMVLNVLTKSAGDATKLAIPSSQRFVSKNGTIVLKNVFQDGSVVVKSFKADGTPFKTIVKSVETNLQGGANWYKPNAPTTTAYNTVVQNHLAGTEMAIQRNISSNSPNTIWSRTIPTKENLILEVSPKKQILEKYIWKMQPEGGQISVTTTPYISDKPYKVKTINYRMPNGQISSGEWGIDKYNMLGLKRVTTVENVDGITTVSSKFV